MLTLVLGLLLGSAVTVFPQMTSNDVATVISQAVARASVVAPNSVIAVVDREGFVLGVWSVNGSFPATSAFTSQMAEAIARAGTAAFLSSDQEAFTTRTALMIVQQHFPPGIRNTPTGPLVGVNFSSLFFSDVNRYKNPAGFVPGQNGGTNGGPVVAALLGGLDGIPGGVPLYNNGTNLIGGVGVAQPGDLSMASMESLVEDVSRPSTNEDVALSGQLGFQPDRTILATHVLINGIRLPYVRSRTQLGPPASLGSIGANVPDFPLTNSPTVQYPPLVLGGVPGEMRSPIIDDPATGLIDGQPRLTASDVTNMLTIAAQRAAATRAGIRLPRGQSVKVFISVVNNPNAAGMPPQVLGTFRVGEATIFSWDVSVQKARTALFFSSPLAAGRFPSNLPANQAYSTRAIGFLAQSLYPPGIFRTANGPFLGLQEGFSTFPVGVTNPIVIPMAATNPLNNVVVTASPGVDPNLPNGITIFPGGFPLYRNGVLIGALGVSGDGVDQDDLIAASGAALFAPTNTARSDRIIFRGARLPYAKFPRNPSL
jgi:uncharacterized protein GlcG (DUF336 family)